MIAQYAGTPYESGGPERLLDLTIRTVHPDDAKRTGVVDGGLARVSSEAGTLDVPVEVSDEMMPGVVSLPHGWGHDVEGVRLSVAREHTGVNNDVLAPGHLVDEISGNAVVNGIPIEVVPA